MSKDEAPNFRSTTPNNCWNCEKSSLHSYDFNDRAIYVCDKYDFFIPDGQSTHVCDGWEE